jgi:hypothetical protein
VRIVVLLILPLAAGCFLSPTCGPEARQLDARAEISPPGDARVERMDVSVGQSQDSRSALSFVWRITGTDLQFRVQSVRIVDAATDSLLVALALTPFQLAGGVAERFPDRRAADRLYDMILQGETAIVIVTDIPGRERIVRPLAYRTGYGWSRAACD